MIEGEHGDAVQYAMRLLVKYGDVFDAQKMVPIRHAHISCTFTSIEGPFLDWFQNLVEMGGRVAVPATTTVTECDLCQWKTLDLDVKKAKPLIKSLENQLSLLKKLGLPSSYSCVPFWLPGIQQLKGSHIVSCESPAIIYWNSVLGVRTNRECCQSALLAAITGRTPSFGYHLTKNRSGSINIHVKAKLRHEADWSMMGYSLADWLGLEVPVFSGMNQANADGLSKLCAALTTKSAVTLFHIVGLTPEATSMETAFQGKNPKLTYTFTTKDLLEIYKETNPSQSQKVDFIYVGCPHLNINQIANISKMVQGKNVNSKTTFWIGTNRSIKQLADMMGYTNVIERSGAKIIVDTCSGSRKLLSKPPEVSMFDSTKQAYYCTESTPIVGSIEDCVKAAVKGIWEPNPPIG